MHRSSKRSLLVFHVKDLDPICNLYWYLKITLKISIQSISCSVYMCLTVGGTLSNEPSYIHMFVCMDEDPPPAAAEKILGTLLCWTRSIFSNIPISNYDWIIGYSNLHILSNHIIFEVSENQRKHPSDSYQITLLES